MNAQQSFRALVDAVTVGLDNAAAPEAIAGRPPRELLDDITATGTCPRLIARPVALERGPLPRRAVIPTGAARTLKWMVRTHPDAVAEMLAAIRHYSVPGDVLLSLLELAVADVACRRELLFLLEANEILLVEAHPRWCVGSDDYETTDGERYDIVDDAQWQSGDVDAADSSTLLTSLGRHLSPDDEPLLEQLLDDPEPEMHRGAAELLARLPDSQFMNRARARGRGVLGIEHGEDGDPYVAVAFPGPPAPDAIRDGLAASPRPPQIELDNWRLHEVVAAAPLDVWTSALRLSVDEIVSMAAVQLNILHHGWQVAALREGSVDWARALLAYFVPAPDGLLDNVTELERLLPTVERNARLAHVVDRTDMMFPFLLERELSRAPSPWPDALIDAVFAAIERSVLLSAGGLSTYPLAKNLAARLPVDSERDLVVELRELARRARAAAVRPTSFDDWPTCLGGVAATVQARREFIESFRGSGRCL